MTAQLDPDRAYRLHDLVAHYAVVTPLAEALVLGDRRFDYAGQAAAIDALAAAMIAAGVARGDRVAALEPPGIDAWLSFLACASIGAIWVGLNPRYRWTELRHVLGDADPTLVFVRHGYADAIDPYGPELAGKPLVWTGSGRTVSRGLLLDDFLAIGRAIAPGMLAARRAAVAPRDACLLVYTSGSTGTPKGALLHHEGIVAFALHQNAMWPVDPFRVLNYLPVNHIGCIVDIGAAALAAGGAMVFLEQFDPATSLGLMAAERISVWGSVPSVFRMQLDDPSFVTTNLSAVQLIVWGGAAMGIDLIDTLARFCPRLATNYGMTETSSAITALAPTDDRELLAGSVGEPLSGVEVRLAGEAGPVEQPEVPGEVLTRSRLNFLGYWRNPAATAAAFDADGYFRTGDVGMWREDGRLALVGRTKEMFKSGGYNVYPLEIEQVIEAHPAVAMVAVVGKPDPLWQEVGCAFVMPRDTVTVDGLLDWCRTRLANYKIPKQVVIVEMMPLLPIGKIDKAALKRRAALC
ncbi:class I adenylate-forming enzyme family protein [Sphingomonas sp. 28-63-12]|uniref:class I adenylate-forming enzyme family protein n=1 Tax=Sphingomonas sp. 28-63-12 TaxID=1970434 RepID=UPI000BC7FDDC|nr:MAG: hypothetical protein B7Y47_11130 [Sphingomonas sp. 28-63-12]